MQLSIRLRTFRLTLGGVMVTAVYGVYVAMVLIFKPVPLTSLTVSILCWYVGV